ncbi:hypothetical protein KVT40_001643 [Elsinoe batatas]|uniref:Uncharacterized protein n=1 Tax=Elsinoe batatas TaxID=2601811 RepID=A0A8K0L7Q6_9PEZI|nr:hypothetical protein KVT40_001643 [Elsinoe batatas]
MISPIAAFDRIQQRTTIRSTKAFGRLMARVQTARDCVIFGHPTIAQIVRFNIAGNPPTVRTEPETGTAGLTVDYTFEWNPQTFVKEQQYTNPGEEAILNAITLTGTWNRALATTPADYLTKFWPVTSERTMMVLRGLVREGKGTDHNQDSIHVTYIKAKLDGPRTKLELHGDVVFITEIAAQFCWLACSLRSATADEMATSTLQISFVENKLHPSFLCKSKLQMKPSNLPDQGTCWQAFFRNAVIVKGSPIPRLANEDSIGLEISLPMMTALVGSQTLTDFGGSPCIKGFAGILIPTKMIGNVLVWHLIANTDRSYLSYADPRARAIRRGIRDRRVRQRSEKVLAGIECHVVGWCPRASILQVVTHYLQVDLAN